MTELGMFTNEGNVALAQRLNDALATLESGLMAEDAFERVIDYIRQDTAFCEAHEEWEDTAVREIIWSWVAAPEQIALTESTVRLDLSATVFVTVKTADDDGRRAVEENDQIREIFSDAIVEALDEIKRRRLVASVGEWSGLEMEVN